MNLNTLGGILRAILPASLAYAVGKGWIGSGSVADISAAVLAVLAAISSVYSNTPTQIVTQAAAIPEVEKIVAPALSTLPSPKVVAQ